MKDKELTKLRWELGVYQNRLSEVDFTGREYLAGKDVTKRRWEVYDRDKHRCVLCNLFLTFETMEMDHIGKSYAGRKFDNIENLRVLCRRCHREKHVKMQFTKRSSC